MAAPHSCRLNPPKLLLTISCSRVGFKVQCCGKSSTSRSGRSSASSDRLNPPKLLLTISCFRVGFKVQCCGKSSTSRSGRSSASSDRFKNEHKGRLMEPKDSLIVEQVEVGEMNFKRWTRLVNRKIADHLLGVEISPDIVAIALVYFVQGILGLSRLAVSFFLKDDLHLDPAETALLSGVSSFPWLVKPLYGFISDGLPVFGYRRRSYLVMCGFLGAAAWTGLAALVTDKYGAVCMIFLSSLSIAFSDVVVDSMVVERARGESQNTSGSLQSLCWGSSAAGGVLSAYFSGYLVQTLGVRYVFGVTAFLPLIISAVAVLVQEEPVYSSPESQQDGWIQSSKSQGLRLWKTLKEPSILLPTLFIFLWQATPSSDTAMFYFTTNKLGFGPEFLGRVRLVTSLASLVGVGVYNGLLKRVPLRRMFLWTTVLGSVLGSTQLLLVMGLNRSLGISDEWFSMGDSLILTVLGQVSFMPILVLAAKLCPPGVEATLFATLMSVSNGAGVFGGLLGAGLTQYLKVSSTEFGNLALLVLLCNLTSLLPLPFLRLLPAEEEIEDAVDRAEKALSNMEEAKRQ